MENPETVVIEVPPAHPASLSGVAGGLPRRTQLYELLVFLALIVPSMVISFFATHQGKVSFDLLALATIVRDVALVCLVVFFLWRDSEPMAHAGWRWAGYATEVVLGLVIFVPLTFGTGLIDQYLRLIGFSSGNTSFLTPKTPLQFGLAAVLVVVVAFAEETIFRGYLILRFANLTRSRVAAVILSTAVFTVGHGYEGTAGLVTVAILGFVFALVYLWRKSLVAPMVMHFLQDFIGIVALPLLAHKH